MSATAAARSAALLLAASLLILAVATSPLAFPQATTVTRVVDGASLRLSGVPGHTVGDGLVVLGVPVGQRATALTDLRVDASHYFFVEAELAGARPDTLALFLWKSSQAPDLVQGTALFSAGSARFAGRIASASTWRGEITAIGVGLVGPVHDSITIRRIALRARSPTQSLAAVLREFVSFEGLDSYSSNFLIGASSHARPRFRPVPAVAAWVGLAAVLYALLAARRRSRPDPRVLGALFLAGWLALDARWQLDLWRQLEITQTRYVGRSSIDKRRAAEDAKLFRFIQEVKKRLPGEPQTVYLLTEDPEASDRYLQLRARYHLLPHNVCTYYSHPPRDALHGHAYFLVFNPRTDLRYDESSHTLLSTARDVATAHGGEETAGLPVERLLALQLGTLYRRP